MIDNKTVMQQALDSKNRSAKAGQKEAAVAFVTYDGSTADLNELARYVQRLEYAIGNAIAQPIQPILTDANLTKIYDKANGHESGKLKSITTAKIFAAMRACLSIAQPEQTTPTIDVDELAQEIRKVNGGNQLGACKLAEALMLFINAHVASVQPVEPHDLQKRLEALHQYEDIAEHYAKCAISPEALRDWVAERMDMPAIVQPAHKSIASDAIECVAQSVQPADKNRVLNGLRDAFMQTAPGAVLMAIGNALQYIDSLDITIVQPVPPTDPDDLTIAYMSGLADGKKAAQTAHVPETDCGNITQTNLITAAQAVLDRWNSPQWEWVKNGPTGGLMQVLRNALDSIYIPAAIEQPVTQADLEHVFETLYDHGNGKYRGAVSKAQRDKAIAICEALEHCLAQPDREHNFCPRCGKRLGGIDDVHTCTASVGGV